MRTNKQVKLMRQSRRSNQTQVETVKDWKCRNTRIYQNKIGNGNEEHSENMKNKKDLFQTSTEKPQ